MSVAASNIEQLIQTGLPDATVAIQDLAGDGNHYRAVITSAAFAGKSRVAQHQMVYAALGDLMREKLHALAIETKIPT
jgi:stress-induced morphogen